MFCFEHRKARRLSEGIEVAIFHFTFGSRGRILSSCLQDVTDYASSTSDLILSRIPSLSGNFNFLGGPLDFPSQTSTVDPLSKVTL